MRRLIPAVAFLALAIPVAAADDEAAKKLNGTYEVIDVIVGGKTDDSKKDAKITFTLKDGTISIADGDRKEEAKFTVDATKKPAHIDIMPGKGTDKKVPGIYELTEVDKSTRLTIAFSKGDGGERPKDFKGEGKSDVVLKLRKK